MRLKDMNFKAHANFQKVLAILLFMYEKKNFYVLKGEKNPHVNHFLNHASYLILVQVVSF